MSESGRVRLGRKRNLHRLGTGTFGRQMVRIMSERQIARPKHRCTTVRSESGRAFTFRLGNRQIGVHAERVRPVHPREGKEPTDTEIVSHFSNLSSDTRAKAAESLKRILKEERLG